MLTYKLTPIFIPFRYRATHLALPCSDWAPAEQNMQVVTSKYDVVMVGGVPFQTNVRRDETAVLESQSLA